MRVVSLSSRSKSTLKGVVLAIVPIVWASVPISFLERAPQVCLWKRMGLYCWGCGMTRAIASALRGDWTRAWDYNHLSVIVVPLLAYLWLRELRRTLSARV
jgi:hypothetical protein